MNYTTLICNNKEYKARLTMKDCLNLEQKLGENPVNVILVANGDKLPKIKDMLLIIHASLQTFHHAVSLDDVMNEWEQDGADIYKLILDTVQVLKDSGWLKDEEAN